MFYIYDPKDNSNKKSLLLPIHKLLVSLSQNKTALDFNNNINNLYYYFWHYIYQGHFCPLRLGCYNMLYIYFSIDDLYEQMDNNISE